MAIVPSGNKKIMVAQSFANNYPQIDFGKAQSQVQPPQQFPDGVNPKDLEMPKGKLTGGIGEKPKDELPDAYKQPKSSEAKDVAEFLFDKLVEFGYPPRRLEQFEDDFVDEKIFPGGIREVSIVIPDRYYASKKRLSDDDFSGIVRTIQEKFKLTFIDAQRKDKKITMNYTSQSEQQPTTDEQAPVEDVLDEVYGGGSKSKEKSQPKEKPQKQTSKKAETINELIKFSKNQIVEELLRSLK